MLSNIFTPIYVNKNLISDLYSTLIDGYIESTDISLITDNNKNIKVQGDKKIISIKDNKKSNTADKNSVKDISTNITRDICGSFEDRNSLRNLVRYKKTYTSFQIFNTMKDIMYNNSIIKNINSMLNYGDYVEFEGIISSTSFQSQINTLINILECYDTKILDKLLLEKDKAEPLTNFSVILKQLKTLTDQLSRNNTVNMIIKSNTSLNTVLNVNLNYFLDKNSYIYDNVNCNCRVLCKVIKIVDQDGCIDLLDKTCMSNYYNQWLQQLKYYLSVLKKNNIIVPEEISNKIYFPAFQAIPIAIYV